jgi:hypothetical protein
MTDSPQTPETPDTTQDRRIAALDPAPKNGPRMGYSTVGGYFATKAASRQLAAERTQAEGAGLD